MMRAIAGVLDRSGAAHLDNVPADALTYESGPLAVAWTGGPAARGEGSSLALIDGMLDRDPASHAGDVPEDAERALLSAWIAQGGDVLAPLRGEFALLLWDGRRGLLASDHVATRCWYWHDDGRRIRFATEIHLLLDQLPTRPGPDPYALAHWLAVSGSPDDRTLYEGIHRLGGAHALPLDADERRPPWRYWDLKPTDPPRGSRGEHAARWRDALLLAVKRRVAGPADTALLLSGGLDSGAVASALPESGRPERAYSATFPDHPSIDESELIGELTDALRLRSIRAVVRSGSVLEGALPHLERWALPPVSPNMFFWNPLMQRIGADGTRVLLDGEGGDEMFGLSPMLVADRLAKGDVLGAVGLVYQAPGALGRPSRASVWRYFRHAGLRPLAPAWMHGVSRRLRGPQRFAPQWMGADLARAYFDSIDGAAYKRIDGPRWWAFKVDMTLRGLGPRIAYDHIRHRTAGVGVMSRHPVLDVDLIETIFDTPPELSFDPYVSRPLLREAMAGLMPENVRTRVTKSRFDAIFHDALAGPDLAIARGLIGGPDSRIRDYVDIEMVRERLLGRPPEGEDRAGWAMELWRMLTAECWLRYLEDPSAPRRAAEAIGVAKPDVVIEP